MSTAPRIAPGTRREVGLFAYGFSKGVPRLPEATR